MIVGWLVRTSTRDAPSAPAVAIPEEELPSSDAPWRLDPLDEEGRTERNPLAPETMGGAGEDGATEEGDVPGGVGFVGSFVLPDRNRVRLDAGTVEFTHEDGTRREREVHDAEGVFVADLPAARYRVAVRAEGYRHREQTLDLTADENYTTARDSRGAPTRVYEHRLTLWPADWIAVIVETPDGRPFPVLADELGLEPRRIFVGAFEARTRPDPPGEGAWSEVVDSAPARFRPAPGYQGWQLPGSCIGSLQVTEPPPFWVGLGVHGVPVGWELVQPRQTEVRFRLDAAALESRFATLTLRVVDAATERALPDARVTLRADTSAHRRADLHDVVPDSEGRVTIGRIVPGLYELSVVHGEAIHQDRPRLVPGKTLDLGTVAIGAGRGFTVQAVREDGSTVEAWVEIGPYRQGENVHDLYPPMLSRHTDHDGACPLPTPTAASIVRATVMGRRSYPTGERSENTLVEPEALPTGALRLVVHDPCDVQFETKSPHAVRIEVLDELELVIESLPLSADETPGAGLIPGTYRARTVDAAGGVLAEVPFEVAEDPVRVVLP